MRTRRKPSELACSLPQGTGEAVEATSRFDDLRSLLSSAIALHIGDDHVQSVLSLRRGREALFGKRLFSDPAWDVILHLYAQRLAHRTTSTLELSRAIGVPESVVARWLVVLAQSGIVAVDGARSGRHAVVRLSEEGAMKIGQLLEQWGSAFLNMCRSPLEETPR